MQGGRKAKEEKVMSLIICEGDRHTLRHEEIVYNPCPDDELNSDCPLCVATRMIWVRDARNRELQQQLEGRDEPVVD